MLTYLDFLEGEGKLDASIVLVIGLPQRSA